MPYAIAPIYPYERLSSLSLRALPTFQLILGVATALLVSIALFSDESIFKDQALINEEPVATGTKTTSISVPASVTGKPLTKEFRSVVIAISKRYRVAQSAVEDIVIKTESAAHAARLDPLLVLAVIGVESGFNPYAESPFGAQGLMQIIGRFHTDKFSPTPDGLALLNPKTNIDVGVRILREYLNSTGDINAALKRYGGESDASGIGYADRVHAERQRLAQFILRQAKT